MSELAWPIGQRTLPMGVAWGHAEAIDACLSTDQRMIEGLTLQAWGPHQAGTCCRIGVTRA
jgi:hypothetical protein